MKSQFNRADLPVETLDKLNEILMQDAESLNEEDAAFLRARRDYLNSSEKERFESILEEPKKPAKVEEPKKPAKVEEPKKPAKVEEPKKPAKVEEPKKPAEPKK